MSHLSSLDLGTTLRAVSIFVIIAIITTTFISLLHLGRQVINLAKEEVELAVQNDSYPAATAMEPTSGFLLSLTPRRSAIASAVSS
jgi:hypothetical protein